MVVQNVSIASDETDDTYTIFEEEKKTPLAEEFAPTEDEVRIDDIDESVTSDAEENETVTVKQTYPDESENYAEAIDDSDIK